MQSARLISDVILDIFFVINTLMNERLLLCLLVYDNNVIIILMMMMMMMMMLWCVICVDSVRSSTQLGGSCASLRLSVIQSSMPYCPRSCSQTQRHSALWYYCTALWNHYTSLFISGEASYMVYIKIVNVEHERLDTKWHILRIWHLDIVMQDDSISSHQTT